MFLITGGCGFIGSNFILKLIKSTNKKILNLDKLSYASKYNHLKNFHHKNYHFLKQDICNQKKLEVIFKKYKPTVVVNFAAESHVDRSIINPDDFIKNNIIGTFSLLKTSYNYWIKFKNKNKFKFIQISTDEVYGTLNKSDESFTENTKYDPSSPYSASKASADHLVKSYYKTFKFPCMVTNCSNNYGPYQFPEKLIPVIIKSLVKNKKIPIYGDGQQIREWLFVEDHCEAILRVINKGVIGESYNIGSKNEIANIELVKKIIKAYNNITSSKKDLNSSVKFVKDRLGHDFRYSVNCKKLQTQLGWKNETPFMESLTQTVKWYLDNPKWLNL